MSMINGKRNRKHQSRLDLGIPERRKRWHYLSVDFEKQAGDSFTSSYVLDDGNDFTEGELDINMDQGRNLKRRLFRRSRQLTLKFSGDAGTSAIGFPVRITGFQLDATPLDSR